MTPYEVADILHRLGLEYAKADAGRRRKPPPPKPKVGPDEAELYFERQRQKYPYGEGYAEGQPMPNAGLYANPTVETLRRDASPYDALRGRSEDDIVWTDPLPPEYRPQPGQALSLTDIIQRYATRGGSF